MNDFELRIHRDNTRAFINERPVMVQLERIERVRTAGGGYKEEPASPAQKQVFRVIEIGQRVDPPVVRTQDGTQRAVVFELLGVWNADVKVGDNWTADDGREWTVGDVITSNQYETRALVVERGR